MFCGREAGFPPPCDAREFGVLPPIENENQVFGRAADDRSPIGERSTRVAIAIEQLPPIENERPHVGRTSNSRFSIG